MRHRHVIFDKIIEGHKPLVISYLEPLHGSDIWVHNPLDVDMRLPFTMKGRFILESGHEIETDRQGYVLWSTSPEERKQIGKSEFKKMRAEAIKKAIEKFCRNYRVDRETYKKYI